jgi:hypothetical protein
MGSKKKYRGHRMLPLSHMVDMKSKGIFRDREEDESSNGGNFKAAGRAQWKRAKGLCNLHTFT